MEKEVYKKWLATIANTRLVFNTTRELEAFYDVNAIHSNGILRCVPNTLQGVRSAFNDIMVEVYHQTEHNVELDDFMVRYEHTWEFYKEYLDRRSAPVKVAHELMAYCYAKKQDEVCAHIKKQRAEIYELAHNDSDIDIPLLILMLLKALPGFDSKAGDVTNFNETYFNVLKELRTFVQNGPLLSVLPAIRRAENLPAERKTRIMLAYYTAVILNTYTRYIDPEHIYQTSDYLKRQSVSLELDGYWTPTSNGTFMGSEVWEIQAAINDGTYFAYKLYRKDNVIYKERYIMFLSETDDERLQMYILHPESPARMIKGEPYLDKDQMWYLCDMPEDCPDNLTFMRAIRSESWSEKISLTRISDEEAEIIRKRNKNCRTKNPYADYEYTFIEGIAAITRNAIYIDAEAGSNRLYRVPRKGIFENVAFNDRVGLLTMKGINYIAFDELWLFIPVASDKYNEYGIECVNKEDINIFSDI